VLMRHARRLRLPSRKVSRDLEEEAGAAPATPGQPERPG